MVLATKPSPLPPQQTPQRPHTIINADATYLQPTSKPLSIEMAAAATAAEVQKGEADFETVQWLYNSCGCMLILIYMIIVHPKQSP